MTANRLSPSRRREDVRAWWAEHLAAQRKAGQTQVAYCRARGLDAKYFTLWKGKLREAPVATPRMVPVVVTPGAEPRASADRETTHASAVVCLRLSLDNGLSVSLEFAPGAPRRWRGSWRGSDAEAPARHPYLYGGDAR